MINVVYSTQHWIFPKITIGILIVLGIIIFVLEGRARVKAGKSFIAAPGRFFAENYDKAKFWGTIVLLLAYFFLLDKIGFTVCSIIFLILFNTLFGGAEHLKDSKYIIVTILVSVIATLLVSIMFGSVFNISLPAGVCTIEIPSMGLIIF